MKMPYKIAALNWRRRFQFGHRQFQFDLFSFVYPLTASVSELRH